VNKLHLKKIWLILFIAAMPLFAHAANLGKLSVFSSLGEPLNAEIDVHLNSPEEFDTLVAAIAAESIYKDQGVERSAIQSDIKMMVLRKDDNQAIVRLSTAQAVSDAFLDMIISLTWKGGALWREYTLLLDPSASSGATVSNPTVAAVKSAESNTSPDGHAKTDIASVVVKKGESLSAIAKRLLSQDVNLDQMVLALYNTNKEAFDGQNMNRLKIGSTLKVPPHAAVQALDVAEAKKEVQVQAADWDAYKNRLATAVQELVPQNNEANEVNAGKIVTKANELDVAAEPVSKDVLKLSNSEDVKSNTNGQVDALKDDLAARKNAIAQTDEKSSALKKQIADMKHLLAIKRQSLADAQNQASQKAAEVVTVFDTVNPQALKIIALLFVLFVTIKFLARFKSGLNKSKPSSNTSKPSSNTSKPSSNTSKPMVEPIPSHENVETAGQISHDFVDAEEIPQLSSLDLSGISLDFEPVPVPTDAKPESAPISDVFDTDFSEFLNVDPAKIAAKSTKKKKTVSKAANYSDVDTKIELATSYLDMQDKRGAKKLLKEALKEGDDSQKSRAQALLDKIG
jgi:FimV-like protein